MKKKKLEKELLKYGWWKQREGGNHEIWTNGEMSLPVARHPDVPEITAKMTVKKARDNPAKRKKEETSEGKSQ